MLYTPTNWYWIVGGDDRRVWSSAAAAYVTPDDAAYQTWQAAGGVATHIASAAELVEVLVDCAMAANVDGLLTLDQLKAEKTKSLSAACSVAVASGFNSAVTGTTLTYTLTDSDQVNLDSAYQLALMAEARAGAWTAGADHALNDVLQVDGGYVLCTRPGTTGTAAPAWPGTYQVEVADGTAGWSRAGYLVGTSDGTIWVSAAEATALWIASKSHIANCRALYRTAKAAIAAATTAAEIDAIVAAIVWP
jgi:hypothetical protein